MHIDTHEQHKLTIARALRDLEQALDHFVQELSHQAGAISVEGARSEPDARRRACEAYATIDYGPEDEPNSSPICLGVIGGTAAVLARAEDVNLAKAALREQLKSLRPYRVRMPIKDGQGGRVVKSLPLVRVILRELTRSDLNVLAAYRKIPILTGRIERVAYTRARTRAVYRKTRAEILALLEASPRPLAADDRQRLLQLPAREAHLALVKEHYTNIRANVWFDGLDARSRGRVMIAAELPLLYPLGRTKATPEIRYPATVEQGSATPKPRTGKLEPEPFLESLPVYRYRPTLRRGQRPRS
jgi:hypothetical protein